MKIRRFSIFLPAIVFCTTSFAFECAVSLPEAHNLASSDLKPYKGFTWVGSPRLAAQVPENGHWIGMGPEYQFRDKWWWWREGYNAHDEGKPALEITATMLDGEAPPVHIPHATNAMSAHNPPRWHRILTLMEFPTPGCWEVTATYYENELKFVFQVGG